MVVMVRDLALVTALAIDPITTAVLRIRTMDMAIAGIMGHAGAATMGGGGAVGAVMAGAPPGVGADAAGMAAAPGRGLVSGAAAFMGVAGAGAADDFTPCLARQSILTQTWQ